LQKLHAVIFIIFITALSLMVPGRALCRPLHHERAYQESWCEGMGGTMEARLPDRTRVDCLTTVYAVEVDFARKWAEAIGQSLFYSAATGRRPGVLMIIERPGDRRFLKRLRLALKRYRLPVRVWTIGPSDLVEGAGPQDAP